VIDTPPIGGNIRAVSRNERNESQEKEMQMDPKATLATISDLIADEGASEREVSEAINDLLDWIDRGGFIPQASDAQLDELAAWSPAGRRLAKLLDVPAR
jgi:hypothetical protein